jgi:hypothetical protein
MHSAITFMPLALLSSDRTESPDAPLLALDVFVSARAEELDGQFLV